MNDIEKQEFLDTINSYPLWVETKEDALKYAKHLHYRLIESRKIYDASMQLLAKLHPELYEHICEETLQVPNDYRKVYESER